MSKDKIDKLESLRGAFVEGEAKMDKLEALRRALIEGEESGMVECSLDDIMRELSVELGWIELRLGQGEIVTDDDTFFDDIRNEIRDVTPTNSSKGD